jgi:hypothetical protein
MAANTVVRFSATVQDEAGLKASVVSHLYVDSAQTVAAMVTALNTWLADLDAITGGQIIRSGIGIVPALPGGIKGSPVAGSEVQEVATFDFTQTGVPYHYGQVVPAFLETAETAAHKPNLADAGVAAFVTLLTTAPVLGGAYTGPGNDALAALAYAFLATRKHRRGERAVSYTRP